ncbi:uncharacterized protein LOC131847998 [Achroia grisella]|uniref:uncharacterized protein LOC131847998 n=1 Tax=Achroia grisella TaxID=688607 RepID=UPI0027D2BC74|nr:uncharacterized protein LOC131847998 [Achroia grisella]
MKLIFVNNIPGVVLMTLVLLTSAQRTSHNLRDIDLHELARQNKITKQILEAFIQKKLGLSKGHVKTPSIQEILPIMKPEERNLRQSNQSENYQEPQEYSEDDSLQTVESEQINSIYSEAERLDVGYVHDTITDKLHLYCNILNSLKNITFCRFQKTGSSSGYNIEDGFSDGTHSYYGDGFNAKHCGMTIEIPNADDYGIWRCSVGVSQWYGNNIVQLNPMQALISVSQQHDRRSKKYTSQYEQELDSNSYQCTSCNDDELGVTRWTMPLLKTGEKRYYLGIFFKANWFKAQQYCRFHGMHLASISSQQENDKLEQYVKDSGYGREHFWTSGTDLAEEGNFFWMANGRPLTFVNWNAGEPNNFRYENGEEENCLELWNRDDKGLKWNDSPCSFETFFICEVRSD